MLRWGWGTMYSAPFYTEGSTSRSNPGCKKSHFYSLPFGQFTSQNIISTSPKNVLMSRWITQFFCNLNSSKNFACLSGKLITEFTSPIAKSTSPGLSDSTFFARCNPLPFLYTIFCIPPLKNDAPFT